MKNNRKNDRIVDTEYKPDIEFFPLPTMSKTTSVDTFNITIGVSNSGAYADRFQLSTVLIWEKNANLIFNPRSPVYSARESSSVSNDNKALFLKCKVSPLLTDTFYLATYVSYCDKSGYRYPPIQEIFYFQGDYDKSMTIASPEMATRIWEVLNQNGQ
jgi:hypothetical protein